MFSEIGGTRVLRNCRFLAWKHNLRRRLQRLRRRRRLLLLLLLLLLAPPVVPAVFVVAVVVVGAASRSSRCRAGRGSRSHTCSSSGRGSALTYLYSCDLSHGTQRLSREC